MKCSFIVPIISYGKYSKIFVNYLVHNTKNKDLLNYLFLLKSEWVIKDEKLLQLAEELLKETRTKGLQYLIMTTLMDVSELFEDFELNNKYFTRLIREFKNVPPPYRNIVGKALNGNRANICKQNPKNFRMWSEIHDVDEADTALLLNAKGRQELNEGKTEEAIKTFHEVHEHALKFPHPTFVLTGINNAAWYLYKLKNKDSLKAVNTLLYYSGYFFDEESAVINAFDTSLTVLKTHKNFSYFEMAQIMLIYYNRLLKIEPSYKKQFVKTIKYAKSLSVSTLKKANRINEIKNTHGLQVFLKENIGKANNLASENGISITSMYTILNGETENIKTETLKKIVRALGLYEISFDYPRTINLVIQMIKLEEAFERNWNKVSHFSAFQLKKLFLKGFMALVSLEGIVPCTLFKLAEKDRLKLFSTIESDPKLIAFFNRCVFYEFEPERVNPYYKARLDLANILFSEMGAMHHITPLIRLYSYVESLEEHERLNVYFRQYVRYSTTPWRFDVEEIMNGILETDSFGVSQKSQESSEYEKIAHFCKKINISELFGYLCTWEFEGEEREAFVKLLLKLS